MFYTIINVIHRNCENKSCFTDTFVLFKLGLAAAALVGACSPPAMGVSLGWTCYLAATAFIAASASVGIECGDN